MNLLKPFKVTLASNYEQGQVIDDELIGTAVMGWIEIEKIETENGETRTQPVPMFVVVWDDRILQPATSIYRNEEIVSLGIFADELVEYEDEDEDDENQDYEEETLT